MKGRRKFSASFQQVCGKKSKKKEPGNQSPVLIGFNKSSMVQPNTWATRCKIMADGSLWPCSHRETASGLHPTASASWAWVSPAAIRAAAMGLCAPRARGLVLGMGFLLHFDAEHFLEFFQILGAGRLYLSFPTRDGARAASDYCSQFPLRHSFGESGIVDRVVRIFTVRSLFSFRWRQP